MTKTFSSLPTKMAQPLLAGRIPRISTGTTSFFIPTVYCPLAKKQVLALLVKELSEKGFELFAQANSGEGNAVPGTLAGFVVIVWIERRDAGIHDLAEAVLTGRNDRMMERPVEIAVGLGLFKAFLRPLRIGFVLQFGGLPRPRRKLTGDPVGVVADVFGR